MHGGVVAASNQQAQLRLSAIKPAFKEKKKKWKKKRQKNVAESGALKWEADNIKMRLKDKLPTSIFKRLSALKDCTHRKKLNRNEATKSQVNVCVLLFVLSFQTSRRMWLLVFT